MGTGLADEASNDQDPLWVELRARGLRRTGQRDAVLHLLAHDGGHLTVPEIHEKLSAAGHLVDLTTVYRTVTTLAELGVVHATARTDHPTSYGLATRRHHHAVCTRCGTVVEIPPVALSRALETVQEATGFEIADAGVTVQATCPDCASR